MLAIVLLSIWFAITFFIGNILISLVDNIPGIGSALGMIVYAIQVISYVVSFLVYLLYLWCVKKDRELRCWASRKKQNTKKRIRNTKIKLANAKSNAKQKIKDTKDKLKESASNQWWYIEDDDQQ